MIYVDIFHKKSEDEDYQGVERVVITFPNEEDFMQERKKEEIIPYNGHLNTQFGIYSRKQGFFNNMLEIRGAHKYDGVERKVTKILPIGSCVISEYYG